MLGLECLCLEIVSCDCGDSSVLKTLDPEGFRIRGLGCRVVCIRGCAVVDKGLYFLRWGVA